jgi:RNA polymerase sigma-70 factor, ECF subfamily
VRRPRYEEAIDEETLEAIDGEGPGPLEQTILGSEARALMECLKRLDQNQRQSIMLAFFEGLTHSELAARLRQPLGTIKTWVRRGLERLRSCLET